MLLEGSCHCGAVKFSLNSPHPYPFNYCYCSICRKTQGGGGYVINLSGQSNTLQVRGEENISIYHAKIQSNKTGEEEPSPAERRFCKVCSSNLWLWDPRWPDLIHPVASAIDTPLPTAPERTHLMLGSKPDWVPVETGVNDQKFDIYPDESIEAWHKRLHLER